MLDKKLREPVQLKKTFDVADMRRHLENLAFEDEEEIKKKSPRTQEQHGLKLMIKVSFLREEMPPPTDLSSTRSEGSWERGRSARSTLLCRNSLVDSWQSSP